MNYLVIDLEATCWDRDGDHGNVMETIEIGAAITDNNFNIIATYDKFIQPVLNPTLSKYCTDLTSITQADIDKAQTFPEVFKEFTTWVHKYQPCIFASWGDYDKNQLMLDTSMYQIPMFKYTKHINLKTEVKNILKIGKRQTGLRRVMEKLNMTFEGTQHRGIDDVLNIVKVCQKVMALPI